MNIIVDGKKAMLKQGFSFEYTAENRLFLGRDGYTLSIAFPLKDCLQNVAIFGNIHRADVAKGIANFECAIISGDTSLYGTLSVVKISDVEVECQFSEGRCAQTVTDPFEDTLISQLNLGSGPETSPAAVTPANAWHSIDNGANEVALPWVNEGYPTAPNNWVKYESGSYTWDEDNRLLSWQPYLIVIAKRICDAIGYEYDFTEWEQSPMRHLIICNTLPGVSNMPEYANVLPAWTVTEFFEKLELFLMCEFDFDHKAKSVRMSFSKTKIDSIAPVRIDETVDTYGVDVSREDNSNCDYIGAKRLAYKECSHQMQKYYACDWFVSNSVLVKRYDTLALLIEKNKRRDIIHEGQLPRAAWGESYAESGNQARVSTVQTLLYAKDIDTYFVFRSIGTELLGISAHGQKSYTQLYVLQPVNVFGSGSVESDDVSTEEIEFVPVNLMDTFVSAEDDKGFMMFLNPSTSQSSSSSDTVDTSGLDRPGGGVVEIDNSEIRQPMAATSIENGKNERSSSFYDEIYVAFWDGTIPENGKTPYPVIDSTIVTQSWTHISKPGYSMRLAGSTGSNIASLQDQLPQINARQKFKFSWIGNDIPNPRAIFHIRGKRYLCEKITATFTEDGMSQLLKGEFYPLLDG